MSPALAGRFFTSEPLGKPLLLIVALTIILVALGLCCCAWRAFSGCGKRGPLCVAVCGLLIAVASLVVEHKLQVPRLRSHHTQA